MTIEDPVEYIFTNNRSMFTQREVGRDTPSFTRGLRAAMRQAPDVIFVGEIRDHDTAFTALQACEEPTLSCRPSRLPRTPPVSLAPLISIPAERAGRS